MKNIFITIFILLFTSNCFAEGLGTLIEVAKDQDEIQKVLAEETKNFENVKKGIESGSIKKGMPTDQIKRQYGAPVVIVSDKKTNAERWVYKPAGADYFKGTKIYLVFDETGILQDTQIVTGR